MGVLEAEDVEDGGGSGVVDGGEGAFGVVWLVEVGKECLFGGLVGDLVDIVDAAWVGMYSSALMARESCLLASPDI